MWRRSTAVSCILWGLAALQVLVASFQLSMTGSGSLSVCSLSVTGPLTTPDGAHSMVFGFQSLVKTKHVYNTLQLRSLHLSRLKTSIFWDLVSIMHSLNHDERKPTHQTTAQSLQPPIRQVVWQQMLQLYMSQKLLASCTSLVVGHKVWLQTLSSFFRFGFNWCLDCQKLYFRPLTMFRRVTKQILSETGMLFPPILFAQLASMGWWTWAFSSSWGQPCHFFAARLQLISSKCASACQ